MRETISSAAPLPNLACVEIASMMFVDDTPKDVAKRMRKLATGMTNPADVEAIRRYADWIEAGPDTDVMQQDLGEELELDDESPARFRRTS
jgi:hypothetical protein